MLKYGAPVVLALSLAACGGGGGGTGTATPSTPAPSAPAAPATNATLTNLVASQSFSTAANTFTGNYVNSSGVTTPTSVVGSGADAISVTYNLSDQSYTVVNLGETVNFAPSNRDAANSNAAATAYSKVNGNTEHSLVLATQGAGLQLTYTNYGVWQRDVTGATTSSIVQSAFVYGIPTAAADLPRTGSATYASAVGGFWLRGGDVRVLSGTGSLSANFAAGTTQLSTNLVGVSAINGGTFTLGAASGPGTINTSNATISGAVSAPGGYSGPYAGRFYGPQAAEVGVVFNLTSGSDVVQGFLVGKK